MFYFHTTYISILLFLILKIQLGEMSATALMFVCFSPSLVKTQKDSIARKFMLYLNSLTRVVLQGALVCIVLHYIDFNLFLSRLEFRMYSFNTFKGSVVHYEGLYFCFIFSCDYFAFYY